MSRHYIPRTYTSSRGVKKTRVIKNTEEEKKRLSDLLDWVRENRKGDHYREIARQANKVDQGM